VLLCREDGLIIDAMRRLPKRGETGGLYYTPETPVPRPTTQSAAAPSKPERVFAVREFAGTPVSVEGSFNRRIDDWYAQSGEALSLEALRAEAARQTEGSVSRIEAALESLRSKEADYVNAPRLKEYGDIIMANIAVNTSGGWLDAEDFYRGGSVRIAVDGGKSAAENAAVYYRQYRKARNGLASVQAEIAEAEAKIAALRGRLERLLREDNPLRLQKLIAGGAESAAAKGAGAVKSAAVRPGLAFIRDGWLIIVGRDARENDALLRRHVKGNDLWLHARDYAGSYVFIKQRRGKTVPLPVLLDAGSLALFYSKGRNAGKGDIFYTHVKYLRRAKGGVLGLVIPTQERNLRVTLEDWRLKQLEAARTQLAISN
jgi:predicted ribosome quality control (RQC) complex YloA/Tae2 family protein